MNTFTITLEIKTYSDSPEDWIAESIVDQLEEDEELISVTVAPKVSQQYEQQTNESLR